MSKNLVIVESPSKSKTIEKYLGSDYKVVSSKGHICDLATSGKEGLGIDIDHDFKPTYKINSDKKDVVKELKKLAKNSGSIYLASDPDREGEAIAWHLARELDLDVDSTNRIIFHEITKPAILEAIKNPSHIDMDLVRSQETRRMLDRIIGFKLSKLLKNKIQSKSAGRVQSVALHLIVEREKEIQAFQPKEYWSIHANLKKSRKSFTADLTKVDGKKPKLENEEQANAIVKRCHSDFVLSSLSTRSRKRQPKLPFTTSTLQQESSTKLGYGAKKTMTIAQKLYEGIDLGGQMQGLITYMRSDSTRLSDLFVKDAHAYIENEYGKDYIGPVHAHNSKNAQDAHEAIRPTNINNVPEKIKAYLTNEQYRLYSLIYARTVASLMSNAVFSVTNAKFECNGCEFTSSGQMLKFDGYLKVYSAYEKQKDEILPALEKGELFSDVPVEAKQHFTEPPARYTEARLIKDLEEKSIGRPSTYAMIIDTLQKRGYALLQPDPNKTTKTKVFFPSDQGILTDEKLQEYFKSVINVEYTANMENSLDSIADGDTDPIAYLHSFYDEFEPLVEDAYDKMPKKELERVGRTCPDCGGELVYRNGKYGRFISCINFPKCRYTESQEETNPAAEEGQEEKICPNCGAKMLIKKGRFGPFWACTNYPECKTIVSLKEKAKPQPTGEKCPECGHDLVLRKSRFGTTFVGCSNYPKCRYIKKSEKKKESKDAS